MYVGETKRLYRRWNEHQTGRGGVNTSLDDFDTVVGLYRVSTNSTFLKYYDDMSSYDRFAYRCQQEWGTLEEDKETALQLENHITERLLHNTKNKYERWPVSGGKYTTYEKCEKFCSVPENVNSVLIDRPLCRCGVPCEVKMKNDKTNLYFTCPVPTWVEGIKTGDRCNFYSEFEPYRRILEAYHNKPSARQIFAMFADD
jgi:hypothetical protein